MAVVVSLRELVDELKIITDEHHVFLNKVTGKTVTLTDEDISAVESGDDTAERQDWEQEVFEQAKEVLWSDDYLELPSKFDIHEYKIMERFCLDFPDERISDELLDKIRGGSGAFRRFKDAKRMVEFKDWRAEDIKSIQSPMSFAPNMRWRCSAFFPMQNLRYCREVTENISARLRR